jgi:FkbM family methyltransferase
MRGLFGVLRFLLVAFTGHGYDRAAWQNDLHHKLAYRLHRALPAFGITGVQRVPLPHLPKHFMYVRAEDGGVAHQLIMYREYEPFESSLVRKHLQPGMTVYNIGANLGYYALLAAERGTTVFAFEPAPENLDLLRRTVAENHVEQKVSIIPAAVSSKKGSAMLSLSSTNSGDHRLTHIDTREHVEVEVTVLDVFSTSHPEPDMIIMDVQGAELDVLLGGSSLLQNGKLNILFAEFWPKGLNERHENGARRFLEILERGGYALHQIDEKRRTLIPTSTDDLLRTVTANNEANLFCIRSL